MSEDKPPETTTSINVQSPSVQHYSVVIILTAFGIIGTLTAASIFLPEQALKVETIIAASISGLFGFIAGRKA